MKVTLQSTTRIVELEVNGAIVPGRIWEGQTESGIHVVAVITRVVCSAMDNQQEFVNELQSCAPPSSMALDAIPLKMII